MPQVAPLRPDDPKRVGRYRVSGRLTGTAGSSLEFLGRAADGDRVMISLLAAERTPDAAARDRFTAEARAARRVAPFCAARILDAGLDGSHAFLVSEYIAGPLLTEFVTADGPRSGPELEALATGLATGLAAIHQAGLVHGSFGPEHVAMGPDGPRVAGFSITPPYGTATPSADMLAWAQTILYAATGKPVPDQGDLAVLPEPLRGAVASCASADPSVRPAARQVVLWLLGEDDPPAGVLAEGSRRAAGAGVRTAAEPAEGTRPPAAAARPQRAKVIGWVAAAVLCVLAIVLAVHVLQSAGSDHGSTVKPASARPASRGGQRVRADVLAVREAVNRNPAPAGDPARRRGRQLGGLGLPGQRQHHYQRQPHREHPEREDHLLGLVVHLLGHAEAAVGVRPGAGTAAGDRRGAVPGRAGQADPERRRAEVQLPRRVEHGHDGGPEPGLTIDSGLRFAVSGRRVPGGG